jgi:hypothetical protein
MALAPGTRLGPYEVTAPLGAGGMGEVYRARDTRLDRSVAVKILPEAFARDPNRLARFEREAKAIAALSHPNILSLHDFGEHEGTAYAVTELLEGETLRQRLAAGPLSPRKALEYAAHVANGLAAAHDKGIVHRDLKPANLFVTTDGRVKILDFGLAAHLEASAEEQSGLKTETRRTDPGTVLGTAGYMSPEQAAGQKADARSDLFSLGCVLYEMLSGKRVFVRDTVPETLTAILREDPPSLSEMTPPLPGPVERLVFHCLEKRPEDRFQSARDLAFALQALSGPATSGVGGTAPGRPASGRLRWLWPAVTLVALVVATTAMLWRGPAARVGARGATFVDIALPPGVQLVEPTYARLSADGRQIVFVGLERSQWGLWLRSLDSADARPLAGTERGWPVAWSPDGRRIVFVVSEENALKEIEVATGVVRAFGPLPKGVYTGDATGSWSPAGDLILNWGSLLRFPASGGSASVEAGPDASLGQQYLDSPQLLPDGRRYLVGAVGSTPEQSGVFLGTLGAPGRRVVLRSRSWAVLAPQGHLLFLREGTLFAQRFDAGPGELSGEPERLLDGVYVSTFRHPTVCVGGGTLAYVAGAPQRHQLTWFDRTGREAGRAGDPLEIGLFDLSPDGTRIAASMGHPSRLWLIDTVRGTSRRFSDDEGWSSFSADGQSLFVDRGGLVRLRLDGAGAGEVLRERPKTADGRAATMAWWGDVSRDERVALYQPTDSSGVWSVPLSGEDPPRPLLHVGTQGRFSPDGRRLAYVAAEGGRSEVFVSPFPQTGARWQVSVNGGVQPVWRGDGRELFYFEPNGNLMSVDVQPGATFAAGVPRVLFRTGVDDPSPILNDYDATDDGQRFLLKLRAAGTSPPQLKLVLDWPALLEKQPQDRP